jgi:hypothetical protein
MDRFGEGRGKPLDEGSAGPILVDNFEGRLISSSGRLSAEMKMKMMMMIIKKSKKVFKTFFPHSHQLSSPN